MILSLTEELPTRRPTAFEVLHLIQHTLTRFSINNKKDSQHCEVEGSCSSIHPESSFSHENITHLFELPQELITFCLANCKTNKEQLSYSKMTEIKQSKCEIITEVNTSSVSMFSSKESTVLVDESSLRSNDEYIELIKERDSLLLQLKLVEEKIKAFKLKEGKR